jgi:hypothetical protein
MRVELALDESYWAYSIFWTLILYLPVYLSIKEGSLFCFVLYCRYEIHRTGMLEIVCLVSLESARQGRVHGLGSMDQDIVFAPLTFQGAHNIRRVACYIPLLAPVTCPKSCITTHNSFFFIFQKKLRMHFASLLNFKGLWKH